MADNTLQWDTIAYLVTAIRRWYAEREDVFVAGDLLWYFEEGNPKARLAPDCMIAIGRPAGYRGSYLQWAEGGMCPQVVFEVLSPKNTFLEMRHKSETYARRVRAEAEQARAETEQALANAEQARAEAAALRAKLLAAGIDPYA